MTLDPATQAISRFLGIFDLVIEEGRLRQDHLKFKLKPLSEDAPEAIAGISAQLVIGGQIGGFDPDLAYSPPAPAMKTVETGPIFHHDALQVPPLALPPDMVTATPQDMMPSGMSIGQSGGFSDGPSSVVAVTIQVAFLVDDDLLLDGMGADFTSVPALHAMLDALDTVAEGLQGFDLDAVQDVSGWMGQVTAVLEQFDQPSDVPTPPAAEEHVHRGEDAQGLIVDGAEAQEAPDWSDILPLHLRPDEEPEPDAPASDVDQETPPDLSASNGETIVRTSTGVEDKTETTGTPEHDFSRDFTGRDDPEEPAGDAIVAGGNLAINEVGVGSQWIDASVIVVRGDVAKVQAVSQVNVLLEDDSIDGSAVAEESAALNIADIRTVSSDSDDDAGGDDGGLPSDWQLYRLSTDLYQVNWTKQVTYVTDFDRAEVTFSAQMTFIGLGGNEIVNSTILNEFGYRFDLMFVAGDMIDATIISQKNVLFDSDDVSAGTGNGMSLGDNLLYNKATIDTTGVDAFAQMAAPFAAAADDLAQGMNTLDGDVVGDEMFAGKDALQVLQIDGDLVKLNLFEQENIIGDADQLRLDMQRIGEDCAAQAKVVAGSNALVNIATVTESGVDSIIMASGTVYDDALIHQAEWFDTDARAEGVKMAGLTNDAVAAFLRDHAPVSDDAGNAIAPTTAYDDASNLDVMQGVLA